MLDIFKDIINSISDQNIINNTFDKLINEK